MRREILMPRLSDEAEEGVLVTWFVEPGRARPRGRPHRRGPGGEGDVGGARARRPVAWSCCCSCRGSRAAGGADRRPRDAGATAAAAGRPAGAGSRRAAAESAPQPASRESGLPVGAAPGARAGGRPAAIVGSGPGGRIVEADVADGGRDGGRRRRVRARPGPRLEPLSPMRRTIADRLRRACVDRTAHAHRGGGRDGAGGRARPLVRGQWAAAVHRGVVRACALALRDHPRWLDLDRATGSPTSERIDIGVAVALDDGLIVPVVRDADRRTSPRWAARSPSSPSGRARGSSRRRTRRAALQRDQPGCPPHRCVHAAARPPADRDPRGGPSPAPARRDRRGRRPAYAHGAQPHLRPPGGRRRARGRLPGGDREPPGATAAARGPKPRW